MATEKQLSPNAEKVLLFEYVRLKGIPEMFQQKTDPCAVQMAVFGRITGMSEQDVANAYAEAQDAGLIDKIE